MLKQAAGQTWPADHGLPTPALDGWMAFCLVGKRRLGTRVVAWGASTGHIAVQMVNVARAITPSSLLTSTQGHCGYRRGTGSKKQLF